MRYLARRRQLDADLAEELRHHRELAEHAALRAGATLEGARREANLAFGSEMIALEDSRAAWRFSWIESVAQDVRFALRSFRRTPGFALTVVCTLALGLGMLATAFSVFNALVLRPFAVKDPYSLYSFLGWGETKGQYQTRPFSWSPFKDFRQRNGAFSDVLGYANASSMTGANESVQAVTGNYFTMLGGRICMGRPLLESDDVPGDAVAVASYAAWKSVLGADPNAVGRAVRLGNKPVEVVGVACPEFNGLEERRIDFWVSLPLSGAFDLFPGTEPAVLSVVGRLRPGMTREDAEAALAAYGRQVYPTWRYGKRPESATLQQSASVFQLNRESLRVFLPVFAAFGLILLIACANVSNMMLARGLARQREIGIRIALGAGRARMLRQLLTECLLLALPAAVAAYWVAHGVIRAAFWLQVNVLLETNSRWQLTLWNSAPDWRVFVFLLGTAGAATLVFGLVPALHTLRSRLVEVNRGEFADHRPARLRSALVVAQVTVCALLLISAGVTLRGERRIVTQDVGADMGGVFTIMPISMDSAIISDSTVGRIMLERLSSLPQAEPAGVCRYTPGQKWSQRWDPPKFKTGTVTASIPFNRISPGYFNILRVPIRGRNFSTEEAETEAPVVIVSEAAAQRLWPRSDALGQLLDISEQGEPKYLGEPPFRFVRVVGVVRDSRFLLDTDGSDGRAQGVVYFPTGLRTESYSMIIVRMTGDPNSGRRTLEKALNEVVRLPNRALSPVQARLDLYLYPYRALFAIAGFLGALALALTVSGIIGVCSYAVVQRKKEFGIRMALGASQARVTGMVLWQSLRLAVVGAGIGALAALALARVTAHYGWYRAGIAFSMKQLDVFDPAGYVAGALVVMAAAIASAWVPAKRAVSVDPVQTLRCD
jgi:predicted permease